MTLPPAPWPPSSNARDDGREARPFQLDNAAHEERAGDRRRRQRWQLRPQEDPAHGQHDVPLVGLRRPMDLVTQAEAAALRRHHGAGHRFRVQVPFDVAQRRGPGLVGAVGTDGARPRDVAVGEAGDGVDDVARSVFLDGPDDGGSAPVLDECARGERGGVARLAGGRGLRRGRFRDGRVRGWRRLCAGRAAVSGFRQ